MKPAVWGTLFTALIAAGAAEAQILAGGEFRVNDATTAYLAFPSLAVDPTGAFMVVWVQLEKDARIITAQRFDAAGARRGAELTVNESAAAGLQRPDVAVDATGRGLVVWSNSGAGGATPGVFGRFVDSAGAPTGSQFTISAAAGYEPSVAATPSGFVVVWSGDTLEDDSAGISGRRVDVAGNPLGAEFQVNSDPAGFQYVPRLSAAEAGGFVVAWSSYGDDGLAVLARPFSPSAAPAAGEVVVTTSAPLGVEASAATDANGRFVVTWASGAGIRVRRFAANGQPEGVEFAANSTPAPSFYSATVASDKSGNFTVAWEAGPLDQTDVFARRFTAAGVVRGGEFRINTGTTGIQPLPTIASDAAGNVFATWVSTHASENFQVFGQRLGGLLPAGMMVADGGNDILEMEDSFTLFPSWRNRQGATQTFQGRLTAMDVPEGLVLALSSDTVYGSVGNGIAGRCMGPCFTGNLTGKRPPRHVDVKLVETLVPDTQGQAKTWRVHVGETFTDVPPSNANYEFVETLVHHNITGGCTVSLFCPQSPTTREQMAVFVLVAKEGAGYLPPVCGTPRFADVPASSPFCPWVEEAVRRGAASGCGGNNFCPNVPITRAQMAVLVLRTLDPLRVPPACGTPMFSDVPAESPFCPWIEELARRGVVPPCGADTYCPADPVTREQMAQFITGTFTLEMYGPFVGHVPWRPGDARERPSSR